MEDIKKIQEFFSKPLEEISTDNVAMKQQYLLTEPVQIAYTDSFGTGMTGAAGVLHRANVGYFIGEEDAYIIVLPGGTFYVSEDGEVAMKIYPIRDQSDEFGAALTKTPFAPKYEDWKDSLRKAPVKEADLNDPVAMKMRANKNKANQSKPDFGKEYGDAVKKAYSGNNNDTKLRFLKKERAQLMRDMEQEAEPEGGPIADEYGSKLNRIDKAIAKLEGRKEMDYDTAVGKVSEAKVEFYQKGKKTFEKEFDTEEEANIFKAKAFDMADTSAVELKEYTGNISMPKFVKDKNNPNFLNVYIKYDTGAGATMALGRETGSGQDRRNNAAEAMKLANDVVLDLEAEYNIEDIDITDQENGIINIFAVSDDFVDMNPNMLGEASKGAILKQAKLSSAEYQKVKKLKDFNKDNYKWNPSEGLYIKLNEATPADDGIAAAGGGTPADQGKAAAKTEGTSKYRKGYSNQKGFSPQLVSPENPRGETDGLTTDTMNKILMKVIGDLDELKQLGEGMIEEKLCKKGQAYRKKRMAAGEKSSAYLNGRAVKVCKGQMKG